MSAGINPVSLDPVIKKLQESGFYWGAISGIKAKSLLGDEPVGKFLVRDSADSRHLFTVTLVTATGITNVRIVFFEGLFSLDKNDTMISQRSEKIEHHPAAPRFDCVVKMVFYYMLLSRKIMQEKGPSAGPDKKRKAIFFLWSPLYKEVSSLQQLCRRALNQQILAGGGKELSVPNPVKLYLSQYPYPM